MKPLKTFTAIASIGRWLHPPASKANIRWLVTMMAVLGVIISALLDRVGWLAGEPLTGNVVAGILVAPATVLLALMIFDRLATAQREQAWVDKRQEVLTRILIPQLTALRNILGISWPLDAPAQFNATLSSLLNEYGILSRLPVVSSPSPPLNPHLEQLTRDVAERTHRADPQVTLATVRATLPALDLVIHQAEAAQLAEAAFGLRTVALSYDAAIESAGFESHRFTIAVWNLAFKEYRWQDAGKRFIVPIEGGEITHTAGGVSVDGFQYQLQLAHARDLAEACQLLLSTVRSSLNP